MVRLYFGSAYQSEKLGAELLHAKSESRIVLQRLWQHLTVIGLEYLFAGSHLRA